MPREARSAWLTMGMTRVLQEVISDLATNGDWTGARVIGGERDG
jgi:hypothetical protein